MIKQRRARPPITPPTIAPTLFEEAGLASVLAIASFVASGLVELSVREEAGEGNDDVGGAVTPELLPVTVDEDFDAEPVTTGTLELGLLTGAGVELEAEAGDEVVDTTEPLEVSDSVFAALAT